MRTHLKFKHLSIIALYNRSNFLSSASRSEYILYVPSTQECPKILSELTITANHSFQTGLQVRPLVEDVQQKSSIGSGYCMYGPEKPAIFSTPRYR